MVGEIRRGDDGNLYEALGPPTKRKDGTVVIIVRPLPEIRDYDEWKKLVEVKD